MAYCWKAPIKFGDIDTVDLIRKFSLIDTTATAEVLCEYGYFNANSFTFTHHIRIKILKKEGYIWANWSFPTSSSADIKGITFNYADGKIIQSKLKKESIFKERIIRDYYQMKVAMPDVMEGSIIDIRCVYSGIPFKWHFQHKIPVKYNELILEEHPYLGINYNTFGFNEFYTADNKRWVMKDVPAFNEEPYVNSAENYISKIEMVFFSKMAGCNWKTIISELLKDAEFGQTFEGNFFLNNYKNQIEETYTTDDEKIKAAYNLVKDKIKWNNEYRIFTSSINLSYIHNKGVGNSADINLTLYVLLKKLGLDVYPLIISTRDNGILLPTLPNYNKPNYIIIYVNGKDKDYFLDATEQDLPYNIIPERCLNGQGRIVDEEKSIWISVKSDKKDIIRTSYNLEFDAELLLNGSIEKERKEYNAYHYRKDYKSFNSENEFINKYISDNPGQIIHEAEILNIDTIDLPVIEKYKVTISNYLTYIDSSIYITPLLYEIMTENPFKNDERYSPIDFTYPIEKSVIINIKIPDNYSVQSIPKPQIIKLPNNDARCIFSVSEINNTIVITYVLNINKTIFLPNEYSILKEFYSQIVTKHNESIVLTKINN